MRQLEETLKKYDYSVPPNLIAQKPAHPRDSAKLLIYDRKSKKNSFDTFINLPKYLPKNAVLVFNDTKVLPARLTVTKPSGGKARILYTETRDTLIEVMSDRKLEINSVITLNQKIKFLVIKQKENFYYLKPLFPLNNLFNILDKYGKTPIPPYIKHSPLSESKLRQEYQTIFAKQEGSVAAPTASLHFTKRLFKKIKSAGINQSFITLHVGLGTFAPLTAENLKSGTLHEEYYSIDKKTAHFLNKAKKEDRPIIAVGTTAARALESATRNQQLATNNVQQKTNLFIQEGYKFKFIDGIITNFHVPKSSLMMLVSALVGRKILMNLYNKAIDKKLRFFSFGDGMLIK
jgi:S-adenosylmethionine:tRNA ribosyltransferase-isomerase